MFPLIVGVIARPQIQRARNSFLAYCSEAICVIGIRLTGEHDEIDYTQRGNVLRLSGSEICHISLPGDVGKQEKMAFALVRERCNECLEIGG